MGYLCELKTSLIGRFLVFDILRVMMRPTRDLLLIKADEAAKQTKSGLLLAELWKTLPHVGTVLAVGPNVKEIGVGDRVAFERYGTVILEDNQRLAKESHVLAIIEGDDA